MKTIKAGMLTVLVCARLGAHPDPMHNIEAINAQINSGDHRPPLYYARGTEYRSIGKFAEAAADYRECAKLDPQFLPARKDLAAVLLETHNPDDAAVVEKDAIQLAATKAPILQASCWAGLARIELARKNPQGALDASTEALRLAPRGELDWYLLRSEAQRSLDKLDDAIASLKTGYDATKSSVLRTAWIDALIDAGRGAEALPVIESEMAECRFKASWLIRRARVRLAAKDSAGAKLDLRTALGELELHISPDDPDPTLIVDRGLTHFFLGEKLKAAKDLKQASALAPDDDITAPLASLLAKPAGK